jgi:hypothetical protein
MSVYWPLVFDKELIHIDYAKNLKVLAQYFVSVVMVGLVLVYPQIKID